MSRHLFLTGDIQVGKSTIISRVLRELGVPVSGFCTVAIPAKNGESDIYLIHAAGTPGDCTPASHLAHRCPGSTPVVHAEIFLSCGVPLLTSASAPLIVMDELGWMESGSEAFQQAVFLVLDGAIPVIGVVRDRQTPFLDAVRAHPEVEVLVVTRENREELSRVVLLRLRERLNL